MAKLSRGNLRYLRYYNYQILPDRSRNSARPHFAELDINGDVMGKVSSGIEGHEDHEDGGFALMMWRISNGIKISINQEGIDGDALP